MLVYNRQVIFIISLALAFSILILTPSYNVFATNSQKEWLQQIQENSIFENSSNDQLAIPQFKLSTSDSYGLQTFDVDGQIQNNRDTELVGAQMVATFVGKDGQFLGSEYGSIAADPIRPGQIVPFKVNLMSGVTNVPIDEIGGIKFRVSFMDDSFMFPDESISSSPSTALPASP